MAPYVLMLQADQDDQYLTQSAIAEMKPSLTMKFLSGVEEIDELVMEAGKPTLILLSDTGDLVKREQILRHLKTHPEYSYIPVIVLGEKSSREYVKECYRAGANSFIAKPATVDATKKKIETFFSYWFEVAEV